MFCHWMWTALLKQPKLDSLNIAALFAWFYFGYHRKLATVQGWMAPAFNFYFKRHTLPRYMIFLVEEQVAKAFGHFLWPIIFFGCTSKNIKLRTREGRTDFRCLSQSENGQQLFLKPSVWAVFSHKIFLKTNRFTSLMTN